MYAGLKLGPDALIISNDKFTNFLARLDKLSQLLQKWLVNRRIEFTLQYNERAKKKLVGIKVNFNSNLNIDD